MTTRNEVEFSKLPGHIKQSMELTDNFQSEKYPKCRCFYLVDGKVIFGINLVETEDSFLVGAPTRMIKETIDSDITVDPLYESQVIRVMKASIALVTQISTRYIFLYLDYLREYGSDVLPDYMNDARIAGTLELMNKINRQYVGNIGGKKMAESSILINAGSEGITVH